MIACGTASPFFYIGQAQRERFAQTVWRHCARAHTTARSRSPPDLLKGAEPPALKHPFFLFFLAAVGITTTTPL